MGQSGRIVEVITHCPDRKGLQRYPHAECLVTCIDGACVIDIEHPVDYIHSAGVEAEAIFELAGFPVIQETGCMSAYYACGFSEIDLSSSTSNLRAVNKPSCNI